MIERLPKLSSRRYTFWSQLLSGLGSKMTRCLPASRNGPCTVRSAPGPAQWSSPAHDAGAAPCTRSPSWSPLPRHRRRRRAAIRSAGPCDRTPDRTRARYARRRSRSPDPGEQIRPRSRTYSMSRACSRFPVTILALVVATPMAPISRKLVEERLAHRGLVASRSSTIAASVGHGRIGPSRAGAFVMQRYFVTGTTVGSINVGMPYLEVPFHANADDRPKVAIPRVPRSTSQLHVFAARLATQYPRKRSSP